MDGSTIPTFVWDTSQIPIILRLNPPLKKKKKSDKKWFWLFTLILKKNKNLYKG